MKTSNGKTRLKPWRGPVYLVRSLEKLDTVVGAEVTERPKGELERFVSGTEGAFLNYPQL